MKKCRLFYSTNLEWHFTIPSSFSRFHYYIHEKKFISFRPDNWWIIKDYRRSSFFLIQFMNFETLLFIIQAYYKYSIIVLLIILDDIQFIHKHKTFRRCFPEVYSVLLKLEETVVGIESFNEWNKRSKISVQSIKFRIETFAQQFLLNGFHNFQDKKIELTFIDYAEQIFIIFFLS